MVTNILFKNHFSLEFRLSMYEKKNDAVRVIGVLCIQKHNFVCLYTVFLVDNRNNGFPLKTEHARDFSFQI